MSNTPAITSEAADHFRKANVLHRYVTRDLENATKYALETGQELLAAKKIIPHGSWEEKCGKLFDGNARTARFYMQFAKDMGALPKTAGSAVLMLEGTLDGAAKAARKAVREKDTPETPPPPTPNPDIPGDDSGDDASPDPLEDWVFEDDDRPEQDGKGKNRGDKSGTPTRGGSGKKSGQTDPTPPVVEVSDAEKARYTVGLWVTTLDAMLSKSPTIDEFRKLYPSPQGDKAVKLIADARGALANWKKAIK